LPRRDISTQREALVRLLAGLDLYRDWRIAAVVRARGPGHVPDLDEFVEPGQVYLDRFDTQPEHAAFWIKQVQDWYAHTASDLRHFLQTGSQAEIDATRAFLAEFQTRMGFDFFSESGMLRRLAKKVLKRGKIADTDEYERLVEVVSNTSQTILSAEQTGRLDVMLSEFRGHA